MDNADCCVTAVPLSYDEFAQHVTSCNNDIKQTVTNLRMKFDRAAKKGNKEKLIELFAYVWEYCYKNASSENIAEISSLVR